MIPFHGGFVKLSVYIPQPIKEKLPFEMRDIRQIDRTRGKNLPKNLLTLFPNIAPNPSLLAHVLDVTRDNLALRVCIHH